MERLMKPKAKLKTKRPEVRSVIISEDLFDRIGKACLNLSVKRGATVSRSQFLCEAAESKIKSLDR